MSIVFRTLTVVILLGGAAIIWGVTRSSEGDSTNDRSLTTYVSSSNGPASAQELAAACEAAFRARDFGRLSALVCWDGADDFIRQSVEGSLRDDLQWPLLEVAVVPAEDGQVLEFEHGGKKYRPNLDVKGRLKVTYRMEGMTEPASSSYLVGEREGRYSITIAAPVPAG
jgi:hypothetical protein